MDTDIDQVMEEASQGMKDALDHLQNEYRRIRAGKATPDILDGIYVNYYGYNAPLHQLATVNTPDARTISIQPWEKSMIQPIEKAIQGANIGLNPQNDGDTIRVNIPDLTEERRKELTKYIRHESEAAKVSVRNFRQEAKDKVKKLQKEGLPEDDAKAKEQELQKMTDKHIEKINKLTEEKEEELLTV
jgi:ribosome recycling factor